MPHPIRAARDLVARYAEPCAARQTALDALDELTQYIEDDLRHCVDCGSSFFLTGPQREFFASRGLREPIRCKPCRDARRFGTPTRGRVSDAAGF